MPKKHTFTATIIDAGGGGAFVEVPFDVEAAFGSPAGILSQGNWKSNGNGWSLI